MPPSLRIRLARCELRPWRTADKPSLILHADNPRVAAMLKDRFPNPYTSADADRWLASNEARDPPSHLAIVVDGAAVGGIGVEVGADVFRRSAEIGYWLGEAYWGRGIATDALRGMTQYALARFDLNRLSAGVFEGNAASARVLEKAGYVLEGRLRRSVNKSGRMLDQLLYAYVVEERA